VLIKIISFGFKHGMVNADAVWDVRFLPNPFYVPELREQTGLIPEVADHVLDNETAREFMAVFKPFLRTFIGSHAASGRETLELAVGCTGGRHRSVAVAWRLRDFLADQGFVVDLVHRDIERD